MFVIVGGTGSCIQIASGAVSAGLWIRHYDGNAWSTWKRMAATDDLANYLPLNGGELSGSLKLRNVGSGKTFAWLIERDDGLHVRDQTNDTNYRDIIIGDNILKYSSVVNGAISNYDILHTGNIANYSSKVVAGTYTGNGTSGYLHQSSLTFDFVPKLIFISSGPATITSGMRNTNAILHPMAGSGMMWYNEDSSGSDHQEELNVSLNGNTVNWYHYSKYPQYQLNYQNIVYNYVAIG